MKGILPERKVGAYVIIIVGVLREDTQKVLFVEHDHMVGARVDPIKRSTWPFC
jgi:hypothetical protein